MIFYRLLGPAYTQMCIMPSIVGSFSYILDDGPSCQSLILLPGQHLGHPDSIWLSSPLASPCQPKWEGKDCHRLPLLLMGL